MARADHHRAHRSYFPSNLVRCSPTLEKRNVRLAQEGRTVAVTVTAVLGSPERPLSPEAARAKFIDCWASVPDLPREQGTALWDAVFALETLDDVRPLAARTSI